MIIQSYEYGFALYGHEIEKYWHITRNPPPLPEKLCGLKG